MKRKAEDQADGTVAGRKEPERKKTKRSLSKEEAQRRFRRGLFDQSVLNTYAKEYATSTPYKHAVIQHLVDDKLLRSVRNEVREHVHFTPKETDIYKIHQSGDLANLDGLDDHSLDKLPSLLALRDAIYSETFRNYISSVTGCGPLSGKKTDMAINVYTPGCFLLCHDDVIGSRRVSYILYLTDPDEPWQPEWGGALRLYPVQEIKGGGDAEVAKTPLPDFVKTIPPAWNQLSFFAVQPGESFHDVEEVYHGKNKKQDDARVRMAISGWFHIPQLGEEGFVEGEEEKNARNSSLMQLQGNPAQYDSPQAKPVLVDNLQAPSDEDDAFDQADLEFLLKYMAPTYLTPDTLERVSTHFDETCSITLSDVFSQKFAQRVRSYIEEQQEKQAIRSPEWEVARPPHKHRYLYQRPSELRAARDETPLTELVDILLPSRQFRQWLQLATGCIITTHDVVARRFRRGSDYTLATGHDGKPRLEISLGLTPSSGEGEQKHEEADVGGEEVYMAVDDAEETDAAVYKAGGGSGDADADDNILFFQAASWNTLSIVLRDSGILKFVKYVSRKAGGDRWDVSAVYDIVDQGEEGDEAASESEEEFQGFSDSVDSESE